QAGDSTGYSRALAHYPRLDLSPAGFSPVARASLARAREARGAMPKGTLIVATSPAGSPVFVDGVALGRTPLRAQVPDGSHAVRVARGASLPLAVAVEITSGGSATIAAAPTRIAADEAASALRLAIETGTELDDLPAAAHALDADAIVVIRSDRGI